MNSNIKSQLLLNIDAVNMKYCTMTALCSSQFSMQSVKFEAAVSKQEVTACLSRSLGQCVAPAVNTNSMVPENGIPTGFQSSGFYVGLCRVGLRF
jgi:hypothetical protein